jgi:hypothetical protein
VLSFYAPSRQQELIDKTLQRSSSSKCPSQPTREQTTRQVKNGKFEAITALGRHAAVPKLADG